MPPSLRPPANFASVCALLADLPAPDDSARRTAAARQAQLTKPPGSLGRLEGLAVWMAGWQGTPRPALERVHVLIAAGNHGVTAQGISAFPAAVTAQMVANFAAGGAAINALATAAGATLAVLPLDLERPTADFTVAPAMSEAECLAAFAAGFAAVPDGLHLLAIGEMGIGNTTVAAALAAALTDRDPPRWCGPGTGLDPAGVAHKAGVVAAGLARHADRLGDPLGVLAALGGRELAAMAGAILAARLRRVPVMLDGYVTGAAALVLHALHPAALSHCVAGHVSAEPAHRQLLAVLGLTPLLDLGLRLGEGSGAALAVPILRAALATHANMATFAEAGVSTT
jgi:nicotinate-nucleotide--dimethylbenzimidazole phosphoribosyltransferase